ncbi:hypothetical protein HERIO_524 [Hepatospora eriocheir]|uniref:Uncharacterized protein n=1 Tax=Hepatospora eriocheir TaxID=1081669 RepID=A0A1X0QD63_9MICR|nr:hypothetical protein HERIO_524 [Hepatospora eriocheir]
MILINIINNLAISETTFGLNTNMYKYEFNNIKEILQLRKILKIQEREFKFNEEMQSLKKYCEKLSKVDNYYTKTYLENLINTNNDFIKLTEIQSICWFFFKKLTDDLFENFLFVEDEIKILNYCENISIHQRIEKYLDKNNSKLLDVLKKTNSNNESVSSIKGFGRLFLYFKYISFRRYSQDLIIQHCVLLEHYFMKKFLLEAAMIVKSCNIEDLKKMDYNFLTHINSVFKFKKKFKLNRLNHFNYIKELIQLLIKMGSLLKQSLENDKDIEKGFYQIKKKYDSLDHEKNMSNSLNLFKKLSIKKPRFCKYTVFFDLVDEAAYELFNVIPKIIFAKIDLNYGFENYKQEILDFLTLFSQNE